MKASGASPLALDTLDLRMWVSNPERWEKVVLKLRAGLMPPAGRRRPDKAASTGSPRGSKQELDRAAGRPSNPGRTEPFHRLNRTEYQNAIRDLLELDVDVASLLPTDDVSYGFDNIAGVLKMSPTLMERYLAAAQKISRLAVGTPPPLPNVDYFRVADDLAQDDHLRACRSARAGARRSATCSRPTASTRSGSGSRAISTTACRSTPTQQLEVSLDGERLQLFTLPGVPAAAAPAARRVAGQAPLPPPARRQPRDATGAAPARGRGADSSSAPPVAG